MLAHVGKGFGLVAHCIFVSSSLVEPCVAMIGLSSTCCPSDLVLFTGYAPAGLVAFGGWIVSIVAVGPWGRTL